MEVIFFDLLGNFVETQLIRQQSCLVDGGLNEAIRVYSYTIYTGHGGLLVGAHIAFSHDGK